MYSIFFAFSITGHYLFVDESVGKKNDVAILQSPILTIPSAFQDSCHISFYYNMRGSSVGKFTYHEE